MRYEYNEFVCFLWLMSQNGYFGSWFSLLVNKYDCQLVFNQAKIQEHIQKIEFINLGNSYLVFADITVIAKCSYFSGPSSNR